MRRLPLILAIAVFVAATLAWLGLDPRVSRGFAGDHSSLNTSPAGLSLARRYLSATRKVSLLTRAVDEEELPRDGVILRIGPAVLPVLSAPRFEDEKKGAARNRDLDPFLTASEESWVSRGGRLVLALHDDYGPLRVIAGDDAAPKKSFPLWPGVRTLQLLEPRAFEQSIHLGHAIFTIGRHAHVSRRTVGAGEVIFIAQPELFRNDSIAKGDHLPLLLQLTSGRPVFFDEAAHGVRTDAGLVELMKRWGLGPSLLLALFAVMLNFWRRGVRVGPAEGEFIDRRAEAVDLVDSMAELYDRSMTRRESIEAYQEMFVRTVAARLFLRGSHLEAKVKELSAAHVAAGGDPKKDHSKEEFQQRLAQLREAFRRLEHEKHR